ncbi:Isochorismatase hydrolase [Aspergillus heteromorphus CBS 117.55]|uniref:Isochorismatase hydrolase n=1 Tax=Aspergillus heteromorphus CBS 117.55 TaxID=1448321 RepID=A0A317V505_9EURO|nr:Isochorismatase hydrolase [Aspergillus heteromorphus CBS 117.55]PWY67947.1 Isochorismatase hydrolase [Aspergillus heteromorphus CBS 117.55]
MASRKALFVIDIQNELATDPKTRVPHAARVTAATEGILQAARSVIDAHLAQDQRSPCLIVFVQHEESGDDATMLKGSEAWELVFTPRPEVGEEILVAKNTGNTFKSNPGLAARLRAAGVTEIIAVGLQSERCVEATCKGALAAGFRVTVLAGAHSTYDADGATAVEIERQVEQRLHTRGVRIARWEEVTTAWVREGKV